MQYSDGMPVELFDHVELSLGGRVYEGQVTRRHPRKGEVRVGYRNDAMTTRAGDAKWRVATVPVARVELIARDG